MNWVGSVLAGVLISSALPACLYKSELKWEDGRDNAPEDKPTRRSEAAQPKPKQSLSAARENVAAPRKAAALSIAPIARGVCARALIAVREPQSTTGAWGKTEIVTLVEMDALGGCPVRDVAPTDARERRNLAVARAVPLKEASVVALEDATDWALGTDDAGNTWRSRTFTAVVEKRRSR